MASLALDTQKAAAAPKVTHFKLKNGMEVVVIPDHRAPVVTHMVWYRVGAADEPYGRSGIAHFLEHLLFKGTEKIAPGEFSKIIARNGGQDNAFTSQDATAYFQRVAKDRLPLVMEMEADRMRNLRLTKKDVLTERKVILEERRSRVDNNPSSILNEQMLAALYVSHPYGIPVIGWENEMRKLSLDDALTMYKRFYAPNNAILIVAGDVEEAEVRKLAEKFYAPLRPSKNITKRVRPVEPEPRAARRVVLRDKRAGKITVERLYLAPSYTTAKGLEAPALDLLMKIAASGTTSRLYKKMVVESKQAASVGGWFSGSQMDSGRIGVYAVAAGKTSADILETQIDEVLADIIKNGVTQKELDRARKSYIASYIYGADSQASLARRYGWGLITGGTIEDVQNWPQELKKVTLQDIQKVARKYLKLERSVTGILLPEAKKNEKRSKTTAPKQKKG